MTEEADADAAALRAFDWIRSVAHDDRLPTRQATIVATWLANEALCDRWPAHFTRREPRQITKDQRDRIVDDLVRFGHATVDARAPI
jgi:hypothetical protein